MKWHFRTIGMGTVNYRKSSVRLAREVNAIGLFDSSIGHSEKFLKKTSKQFWENHKNILKARVPGFGWWIWKPEYIARCLDEIPEGDGILYLDAGSYVAQTHVALLEIERMLILANEDSIVAASGQPFLESNYASTELMDLLDLSPSQRESPQHYAGFLLVVNNQKGRKFVDRWRNLTCVNNHNYLFPSYRSLGDNQLIHHMYDQAILSCLVKSGGETSIRLGDKQADGAIRFMRHRYAYGIDERSLTRICLYKFIGFASRIRLAVERRIFRDSLAKRPKDHD